MTSKIEWLARPGTIPETWNPITGCTKISAGCANCYAERMARRLAGRYGYPAAPHHFDVTLHLDRLDIPLKWRKPRTVFVCSMSDLFHEVVPFTVITEVLFRIAALEEHEHTFIILTKRPQKMYDYFRLFVQHLGTKNTRPLANVWLGVTIENQEQADNRIPMLLQTPAAVRFVSGEPLLGPLDLWYSLGPRTKHRIHCLDWVIVGGESGPGARPMDPDWARNIRNQCQQAGVPFFFKQWGRFGPVFDSYVTSTGYTMMPLGKKDAGRLLDGREHNEWPVTSHIPHPTSHISYLTSRG